MFWEIATAFCRKNAKFQIDTYSPPRHDHGFSIRPSSIRSGFRCMIMSLNLLRSARNLLRSVPPADRTVDVPCNCTPLTPSPRRLMLRVHGENRVGISTPLNSRRAPRHASSVSVVFLWSGVQGCASRLFLEAVVLTLFA